MILQSYITSTDVVLITPVLQKISNINFAQSPDALNQIAQYSRALSAMANAPDRLNADLANLQNQIATQVQQIAQLSIQINSGNQ